MLYLASFAGGYLNLGWVFVVLLACVPLIWIGYLIEEIRRHRR